VRGKLGLCAMVAWRLAYSQSPALHLTLAQAELLGLQNHPAIHAAEFRARAAGEVITEARAARMPLLFGSVTGAGAADGSRLAAGALNNPIVFDRLAPGITASQLITDFGRTRHLIESARQLAAARTADTQATTADVLLEVDRDYFALLRAQAVLTVAEQTVRARQVVADQVTALAQSKLKSDLDVSFANVNLSEAKLLLSDARNDYESNVTALSYALGFPSKQDLVLSDEPLPSDLPRDIAELIGEAMRQRPELASLRFEVSSAQSVASAERDLMFPTISSLAAIGLAPVSASQIPSRYGAAGLNVNIPILNGRLFFARRREAEFRAQAAAETLKDSENRVARNVRQAYLNAVDAYERLDVTKQLVAQARLGLQLAQARYDLGLGAIVELSQAQLNETTAEIAAARAKYDYQTQRAILAYQAGTIR
jgi:outer membrane protein